MVHSNGHVRLIDLGLAALVQPPNFAKQPSAVRFDGNIRERGAARHSVENSDAPVTANSALVALLQVTMRVRRWWCYDGISSSLQSLIPAPRNNVLMRLRAGLGTSFSSRASASQIAGHPLPETTGPLFGITGSVLLCSAHDSDPLGFAASSDDVQDLHNALQLHGLFVTPASTLTRAMEILRRDVAPRIFDVVVLVTSPRMLDGALNLIYDAAALPLEGLQRGRTGTPRRFAAFVCADGMLFEASSSRLREAGALIVGRLPAAPSTLRAVVDVVSADAARVLPAVAAPPSPAGLAGDADTGFSPFRKVPTSAGPLTSRVPAVSGEVAVAPHRTPGVSLSGPLAGRRFASNAAAEEPRSDMMPIGSRRAPSADSSGAGRDSNRPATPSVGAPSPEAFTKRTPPESHHLRLLPALASLTVAGVLQVRFVCDALVATCDRLLVRAPCRRPSRLSPARHRTVRAGERSEP